METTVKQIELNGLLFQYRETGEVSAPPLVALHALGESAESWDEAAACLGAKYRVLALDQRGHGGSARPGTYTYERMRDDLLQFVNHMGLETFTLVGHSMGGVVSYLFAEAWPSRVERLVVEDVAPPFPENRRAIPEEPTVPIPFDWRVLTSILQEEPNSEWWERLSDITAPTLVIGGGSTSNFPQHKLLEVSERIAQCEVVTIEGAGHHVHLSNLPAFLAAVRPFLNV
ncbi:alpha/beta hydrolase [Tumebacillus sp. ITR2]|uniref:Alpha/beta hydrolase n=1 Tax=Tumebacillus amylolyticus TaxID=2801339 RepID=A0ABS1JBX0_9BACL|nr:alpha/beta hydrolase [Tumebacillus amylolyticus]MBL0387771.1 alpha/beta hydrolase [Tumebacillus amylolyticus]